MADQYCSLTHNTTPIIRTSKLPAKVFAPLKEAEPQLQTLVDLVIINGYVIEHSQKLSGLSQHDLLELEARISNLCSQQIGPQVHQSRDSFRAVYEPLARVDMLCCRLKLRASSLAEQASWLPSLCICVHAAEGVLSTYLQLYRHVRDILARQSSQNQAYPDSFPIPVAGKLPPTWRQVKRIMVSAFVIVFAYWHGEMVHGEATRYMAMVRLLLEYPRWRWGEKLHEALQTVMDISSLSGFQLYDHMQTILPGVSERFPRPLDCIQQVEAESSAAHVTIAHDVALLDDTISMSGAWPNIFEDGFNDGLFAFNVNTVEDQTLPGLWESVECLTEGGLWMSSMD